MMGQHYIHNKTIVDDKGIHKPYVEYTVDGRCSSYMTVMTKEDFIRAYVKFILIPNIRSRQKFDSKKFFGHNITDEYLENKLVESYISGNFESYHLLDLV